ncbi:MAG: geranylgeranyl reductase family protein [Aquificaceae bacterium]
MNYDVVVVGGGPAGSSSAFHLSQKGLKVLLLEKNKLPRFKLCAGCLSKRVEKYLPKGWERLVLNRVSSGILGYIGKECVETPFNETVAYIVDRAQFDAFFVKRAQENGVQLVEEAEFLSFEKSCGKYKVFTSKGVFFADFIVGADGFYSKVSEALGLKKSKFFKAIEFFTPGELKDKVIIDIGLVEKGYAWIFPKGDVLSVGLASTGRENLLNLLKVYTERRSLISNGKVYGWHIPYAESERDVYYGSERVLLVGDAANLADPLLGEGIYYAVLSGLLLSEAIEKEPSKAIRLYKNLLKGVVSELVYAGKIAKIAYRFQRIAYRMGKGGFLKSYYRILKGEKGYKDVYVKGWFYFLKEFIKENL